MKKMVDESILLHYLTPPCADTVLIYSRDCHGIILGLHRAAPTYQELASLTLNKKTGFPNRHRDPMKPLCDTLERYGYRYMLDSFRNASY